MPDAEHLQNFCCQKLNKGHSDRLQQAVLANLQNQTNCMTVSLIQVHKCRKVQNWFPAQKVCEAEAWKKQCKPSGKV